MNCIAVSGRGVGMGEGSCERPELCRVKSDTERRFTGASEINRKPAEDLARKEGLLALVGRDCPRDIEMGPEVGRMAEDRAKASAGL
jgi:hypothetical protein